MLCLKRAAKISDCPVYCRLALAHEHYLDITTATLVLVVLTLFGALPVYSRGRGAGCPPISSLLTPFEDGDGGVGVLLSCDEAQKNVDKITLEYK